MIGRTVSPLPLRRSSASKSSKARNRILRSEMLEPRELLSGSGISSLVMGSYPPAIMSSAPVNAAPTIAQAVSINGNAAINGKTASLSVLGSDDGGESNLRYTWSVTTAPAGGTAIFNSNGTNAAKNDTATFTKAGTYTLTVKIVDGGGLSVSSASTVVVSPTLAGIRLTTPSGQAIGSALTVSGTSQTIVAQGLDQFGNALAVAPTLAWSITASPSGAPQPVLSTSGGSETITFAKAGAYGVAVQASAGGAPLSSGVSLTVAQVVSAATNVSTVPVNVSGKSLQLPVATFLDQFGNTMAMAPALTWSATSFPQGASAPSFNTGGVTTATFGKAGSYALTAHVTSNSSVSFVDAIAVSQTLTGIRLTTPSGQAIGSALTVSGTSQTIVAQGLDQFGNALAVAPTLAWSIAASPSGAPQPVLSASGNSETITFAKAGAYGLAVQASAGGALLTGGVSLTVAQVVSAATNILTTPLSVSGKSLQLPVATFLDQFGNTMATAPALTWSATSLPQGASAPSFNTGGGVTTATFAKAGSYALTAHVTSNSSVSFVDVIAVNQSLTGIHLTTPSGQAIGSALAVSGVSQTIIAQGLDQFGNALAVAPTLAWSITASPNGAPQPVLSTSGGSETIVFAKAGAYGLAVQASTGGAALSSSVSLTVAQVASALQNISTVPASVSGKSLQLAIPTVVDQFGNALTTAPALTWSTSLYPQGAPATAFATSGGVTTATFGKAGTYYLTVHVASNSSVSLIDEVVVNQTLTAIHLSTPSGQAVGSALTVSGVSQTIIAQGLDQFGNVLAAAPTLAWSITSSPSGAPQPVLSTSGGSESITFGQAGAYGMAVQASTGGAALSSSVSLTVAQVISALQNASTVPVSVSGTSLQLPVATFLDQFGNVLATAPALTWSATSSPQGAPAPAFATSGGITTATFGMAGSYYLTAHVTNMPSVTFVDVIAVSQSLTSIAVTPNTVAVFQGSDQQFTAQGLDQFQRAMATQPAFAWSTSAGAITAAGLFTAPSSGTAATVTAGSGALTGTATIIIQPPGQYQDPALAALVSSLDADGSISRLDMIQILRSVGASGTVSAADFSDLKKILSQATTLNMPSYVQVLGSDVVNGNAANATFQGKALGNLAVGSSATQLNNLVGKWFFGADHPVLCNTSLVYTTTAGTLFPHTPSHTDEYQGELGDCYLISALGTLADSNPAAIENAIINNGDGTYTVRFYTGTYGVINNSSPDGHISAGFTNNNITADYVTVDSMLPASSGGMLAYADYGASCSNPGNALWIPLIEKAYAQWNQTGNEGRDGTNQFASIQGGWMATVDAQVLGYNANDYIMTTAQEQVAVNALAAHDAVTIGTSSFNGTLYGLYADHAYAITGYNASSDTFTLYNPWGMDQPGQLTWAQLQAATTQLCVAGTSGTVPFGGVPAGAATVKAAVSACVSAPVAAMSSAASDAVMSAPSDVASTAAPQGHSSAAASVPRELLDILGSNWEAHSHRTHAARSVDGTLSASLVDASFAADGLLSRSAA
jgi:hypothetical protein